MSGRLVTIGEALGIFRTEQLGTLTHLSSVTVATGGAEGNVAISAARLGVPAMWIGRVGDDSLGRRAVREMRAEGVDVRASLDAEAPTGLLLKEFDRPGYTTITYHRSGSAGSRLCHDDLDELDLAAEDVLHLTGITPALSQTARDTIFYALTLASEAGAAISYDVNHRSKLWSRDDAQLVHRRILSQAQIAFAGRDEATLVVGGPRGQDSRQLAESLAMLGPSEVVIKLGVDGAHALVSGSHLCQPAYPVSDVVDTVGAGDAFVGAYLAERLLGCSARASLVTAARAGAEACLSPSDWEGNITRAQLQSVEREDPVER